MVEGLISVDECEWTIGVWLNAQAEDACYVLTGCIILEPSLFTVLNTDIKHYNLSTPELGTLWYSVAAVIKVKKVNQRVELKTDDVLPLMSHLVDPVALTRSLVSARAFHARKRNLPNLPTYVRMVQSNYQFRLNRHMQQTGQAAD